MYILYLPIIIVLTLFSFQETAISEEPAEKVIAYTPTPIDIGVSTTIELPKLMQTFDYF